MNRINTAVFFSALGQYATQIITFSSTVVLARILSPSEIGMYSIAGVTIMIAGELRSFGISHYLVREQKLDREKIQTVLGLAIGISWFLGLTIIAAAPFIANFYNQPPIKLLLWIMSVSFFIGPFVSVPVGLWTREMNFKPIFTRTFIGAIVGGASSITLILLGYSYYGLAIGYVLGLTSELIFTIVSRPENSVWVPKFKRIPGLLKFGFYISLTGMFFRFSEGVPDLVIGRFNPVASVGIFSRGFGAILFIKNLLENAVGPVVMPHLSEVNRSGGSVAEAYLKAINLLVVIIWPLMAVASAAAYPMINFLFGSQWNLSVTLTSILALWAILTYANYFGDSALIAVKQEKLMFQISLATYIFRLIVVIIGATESLEYVAWAMVISGVFDAIIYIWALKKAIDLKLKDLWFTVCPNLVIASCCWLVTKLLDHIIVFESHSAFYSIAIIAPTLFIVWLVLLFALKHTAIDVLLSLFPGIARRFRKKS